MRRDRSSRCVMSARDVVDHHNSQRKLRNLRFSNRVNSVLSQKAMVRSNVKHVAWNKSSAGKNASNHSSNHADNRSRLSVGPVRLRRNDPRDR